MEKIFEKTLLYDFYGELLTEHQQEIYENVVFDDMSLSEAAAEFGVSRQDIHDMIRRCDKALEEYEEKLHMVEQFEKLKKYTETMRTLLLSEESGDTKKQLLDLTDRILEELE